MRWLALLPIPLLLGCVQTVSDVQQDWQPEQLVLAGDVVTIGNCMARFGATYQLAPLDRRLDPFGLFKAEFAPQAKNYGAEVDLLQERSDHAALTIVKLRQLTEDSSTAELWIYRDYSPSDRIWADYEQSLRHCARY